MHNFEHTLELWSGTNKNRDISTGQLARSLAPLTHSLAPDRSLCSRPPLRSLVRSLAHFAHSLAHGTVNFWCLKMTWFCPIVGWWLRVSEIEPYFLLFRHISYYSGKGIPRRIGNFRYRHTNRSTFTLLRNAKKSKVWQTGGPTDKMTSRVAFAYKIKDQGDVLKVS